MVLCAEGRLRLAFDVLAWYSRPSDFVCSAHSMDSDSRMGQGLGQNPEKPEGQISLGEGIEGG